MFFPKFRQALLACASLCALTCAPVFAQDPANAAKAPLTHDAYANWRSIQGSVLSRDGAWAAYALVAQEGDGEVVVRHLADGREWRYARGTAPAFSADGRYLAFAVAPSRAELDLAKKEKKKGSEAPKPGLGVMDLASGKVETAARVKRFAWPEQGGAWLAVLFEAEKGAKTEKAEKGESEAGNEGGSAAAKKTPGTELQVWDVAAGKRQTLSGVAQFVWDKHGRHLAWSVSAKEPAKGQAKEKAGEQNTTAAPAQDAGVREGVYLLRTADGSVTALADGRGSYVQLCFDESGSRLAFMTDRDHQREQGAEGKDGGPAAYSLYLWQDGAAAAQAVVQRGAAGLPEGWAPSEFGALRFSKDGARLFFASAPLPQPAPKDAPEPLKVDLWHWKDPELQSMQKVNAEKDKQRHYAAVWHIAAQQLVQLAGKEVPQVEFSDNPRVALGISSLPYRALQSWDALYYDAWAIDLETGTQRRLAEKLRFLPTLSPGGRYVLAFDAASSQWQAWETDSGSRRELTAALKTHFEDQEHDTPEPRAAFGVAGWTADDASVVLYDRYDLWAIDPASLAARNLTDGFGRKNKLELRYQKLDPEQTSLPAATPWLLTATQEDERSSGFYRLAPQGGLPHKLLHGAYLFGDLKKARDADVVLYTRQSFSEFPDLWHAGLDLHAPHQISAANPQQVRYNWGTQELIEYTNGDGKKLKALLAKPENFDPAKKYPVLVYIYEKLSDRLHLYVPPAPGQNINVTRYVSNGYLVLRPDIVYRTGSPGQSALKAVLPAVQMLVDKGYADPQRIGVQGHSWGAYEVNYLITHSNKFRAAAAGASMANMVSGYGGIRWGTGLSRAFQYEKQQSRIGGAPWNKTAAYIENSPIFSVDKVQTPYLTLHNDEDDAVPWYQAIEFFTALRQLGKEAYWFNYNGEKHALKTRENMKHYTVHMAEFFDHYLLGRPRPQWMDQPVPYLERGKRDVMGLFNPVEAKERGE